MIAVYYLLFALALLCASPLLLVKSKARHGLKQKLGVVPPEIKQAAEGQSGTVWFHAVSVGEFNALLPLLSAFHQAHPDYGIIVSTTTATGNALARERAGRFASVVYFPFDLPFAVNAWLNAARPDLVVIVETEIWPGFVSACQKRRIPIAVVNGRMSPRSHRSYHRWRLFFGPILRAFARIGVQNQAEAERYRSIGGSSLNVSVLGNLKFDGLKPRPASEIEEVGKSIGLTPDNAVIAAGSTHEGEEEAILDAYNVVRKNRLLADRVRLVIAPRHPERFDRVEEIVRAKGFTPVRFTHGDRISKSRDVYILDTIGKLMTFYGLADVAFVGGTIAPIGGHNLLEPYTYGVPVASGSHVDKTRDLAQQLLDVNALFMSDSPEALGNFFDDLLTDESKRDSVGERGKALLTASQGAVERALKLIEELLWMAAGDGNDEHQGARPDSNGGPEPKTRSEPGAGRGLNATLNPRTKRDPDQPVRSVVPNR